MISESPESNESGDCIIHASYTFNKWSLSVLDLYLSVQPHPSLRFVRRATCVEQPALGLADPA